MRRLCLLMGGILGIMTMAVQGSPSYLVKAEKLYTGVDEQPLEPGAVLIEGGLIRAVGPNLPAPPQATVLQAQVVTAGLFDPQSALGVAEVPGEKTTVDNEAHAGRLGASLDVALGYNPRSVAVAVNRIEGLTAVQLAPGMEGGSILAGRGAVVQLSKPAILRRPSGLFVTLGEQGAARAQGSRAMGLAVLREALEDARDLSINRPAFNGGQRRSYALARPDLEALEAVLQGAIPLVVRVDRAADMEHLLDVLQPFGVRLIVSGASEAHLMAGRLAAEHVGVLLDPLQNLPVSFDTLAARLDQPALLAKAGVRFAFTSAESHNARNLRQSAGNAVAHGLSWTEALRAITIHGAALAGVDHLLGSLEPGKLAHVVLWNGDPLEVTSSAQQVFIAGEPIAMASRQTLLARRYAAFYSDRHRTQPAYLP